MKLNRGKIFIIIGILAIGLLIRLAVVIDQGAPPHHDLDLGMDEIDYFELTSISRDFNRYASWNNGFFLQSTRAPGYSALLRLLPVGFNFSPRLPQILNCLLDILNIALVFILAAKMFDRRSGYIAATLYTFFGPIFSYISFARPEILAVTLLLLLCVAMTFLKNHYRVALPGLVLIYAMLIHTKPAFLVALPFLGIAIFAVLTGIKIKKRIVKTCIPIALVVLCCVPWTWRNYKTHNSLIPICCIAGWHLVTSAQNQSSLSISDFTDFIYKPEHKDFKEGEVFHEGMEIFWSLLLKNPISIPVIGFCRLVAGWCLPRNFYRFILPQAYFRPVSILGGISLPLPDFEGYCYLFIASMIIIAWRIPKAFHQGLKLFLNRSQAVLILLTGYALAHLMAIPLVHYRFIIEPILLILGLGLLQCVFSQNKMPAEKMVPMDFPRLPLALSISAGLLVILLSTPIFFTPSKVDLFNYPDLKLGQGYFSYEDARNSQWEHLGSLNIKGKISTMGRINYLQSGVKFNTDKWGGEKSTSNSAGRLVVMERAQRSPLGIGDVILNFPKGEPPSNHDFIYVEGEAKTGVFKNIIIEVKKWRPLDMDSSPQE